MDFDKTLYKSFGAKHNCVSPFNVVARQSRCFRLEVVLELPLDRISKLRQRENTQHLNFTVRVYRQHIYMHMPTLLAKTLELTMFLIQGG